MAASQIYMLIFLSFYFGVLIGLRSYMLYRQTNVDPIKKFGAKSDHSKAERLIQAGIFLLVIVAVSDAYF